MPETKGAEIARAYVLVVPSLQGAQKSITEELVPGATAAGKEAGEKGGIQLKEGFVKAAKVAAAAAAAAMAGAVALVKQSLDAYAETEQLAGGIQKIFGDDAAVKVMEHAAEAYKTAGLSANAYMQTVTGVSAALMKSGVSAEEAAELADQAIRQMADNANTYGVKTTEEIGQVYAALSRGNYTMLDNLSLGYAGTKKGMEDLIKDANAFAKATGRAADLSIDNYADIVTAIGLVQESIGIAETTVKEAEGTISGSLSMLSGSWQNFIAGLGDPNADLDALIANVMSSFTAVTGNILPTVQRIASNLVKALPGLVQQTADIIGTLAPTVLEAVVTLAVAIADELPNLLETLMGVIVDNAEMLIGAAVKVANALVEAAPRLVEVLGPAIPGIIDQLIGVLLDPKNLETWVTSAMGIATHIVENLPDIINTIALALPAEIEKLAAYAQTDEAKQAFKDSGKALAQAIWQGIKAILPSDWWTYLLPGGGGLVRDTTALFSDAQGPSYSGQAIDLGGYDFLAAQGGGTTIQNVNIMADATSTVASLTRQIREAAALSR